MKTARTFRIFVSSTFSDFKAERDALQKHVFSRLRALCLQHNAHFQAIDLRWGVSKEAGLNQRATDVCLNEIARCQRTTKRPNFLLLMGDRYGWQPLPSDVPVNEWDVLFSRVAPEDQTALREWYFRDDNAVPPVYVLQPRRGKFEEDDTWNEVEKHLRRILLDALQGLAWSREQRMKYEASVTEQEVEAGIFRYAYAQEGAFCFIRTIDGLPAGARDFTDSTTNETWAKLAYLKQRLAAHIPNNIQHYHARWTGAGIVFDEEAFCKAVEETLKQAIEAELSTFKDISPLQAEENAHRIFMTDHTRHFVGRDDVLGTVARYLDSDKNVPLILHGQPGVGKSTVIAKAIERSDEPLYRFIGITPEASDIRSLLISLCQAIQARYEMPDAIPQDYEELVKAFPTFLAHATGTKPLVIFLDALDQLGTSSASSNLRWLPRVLPPHVKLVISVNSGPYLEVLKRRLSPDDQDNPIEIPPMQRDDGENILNALMQNAQRTLQTHQRAEVLDKFVGNGLPLYLKMAFEEAKLWRSYEHDFVLQPDVPSLLKGNLFRRLSDNAEHGAMLVSRSLAYLQASRNGLSEPEILEVLTQDGEFWADFEARSHEAQRDALKIVKLLPIAVWSRLYFDLEPYLVERSVDGAVLLTFYHRQFGEAVKEAYMTESKKLLWHKNLASYFQKRSDPQEDKTWTANDPRGLKELPYQLINSGQHEAVLQLLSDIAYLDSRCNLCSVYELIQEYELIQFDDQNILKSYADFFRRHVQQLSRFRSLLFFSLVHSEGPPEMRAKAESWLQQRDWKHPWLRVTPAWMPSNETLTENESTLQLINRWDFGYSAAVAMAEENMLAFYLKKIGEIRIVNLASSYELSQWITTRSLRPLSLLASPDGQYLVIAFENGEADLHELSFDDQTGSLVHSNHLTTFTYLVPEYEAPVMGFVGSEFWYEDESGAIVRFNLNTRAIGSKIVLPPHVNGGELSGIASAQDYCLLTLRSGQDTYLVRVNKTSSALKVKKEAQTDVTCLCSSSDNRIVVAFSNHRLVLFDVSLEIYLLGEINLKELPSALTGTDDAVVWITGMGTAHIWKLGMSNEPDNLRVNGDASILLKTKYLSKDRAGIFGAVTARSCVRFTIGRQSSAGHFPIRTVFGANQPKGYYALQNRDNSLWLINGVSQKEIQLLQKTESLFLDQYVFGIDGRGHLLGGKYAKLGVYFEPGWNQTFTFINLPQDVTSILGHPQVGFWLANQEGEIFFFNHKGQCRKVADPPQLSVLGLYQLFIGQEVVIWIATCLYSPELTGQEMRYVLEFYHYDEIGNLKHIGRRFLPSGDGLFEALVYDFKRNRLLVFLQNDREFTQVVRYGTVDDFIGHTDTLQALHGIGDQIIAVKMSPDSDQIYLLEKGGMVLCICAKTFVLQAVFCGNRPVTKLSQFSLGEKTTVLVVNDTDIMLCEFEKGSGNESGPHDALSRGRQTDTRID